MATLEKYDTEMQRILTPVLQQAKVEIIKLIQSLSDEEVKLLMERPKHPDPRNLHVAHFGISAWVDLPDPNHKEHVCVSIQMSVR